MLEMVTSPTSFRVNLFSPFTSKSVWLLFVTKHMSSFAGTKVIAMTILVGETAQISLLPVPSDSVVLSWITLPSVPRSLKDSRALVPSAILEKL